MRVAKWGAQGCASLLNMYHREHLNPYINFHRPCFFPVAVIDHKGKVKNTYPYEKIKTPYEQLKSLPQVETYLRPGISLKTLDAIANQMSDNQFAERMVKARYNLFKQTNRLSPGEANRLIQAHSSIRKEWSERCSFWVRFSFG